MKVLLVDDDDALRGMMKESLARYGFDIVVASGVKEALRQIVLQEFDVLISDLHMPDAGDGFAVVTAMRHFQPNVLTIILSGFPDVHEAMDAICTDVDQVLCKPIPVSELIKLIKGNSTDRGRPTQTEKVPVATILERDAEQTLERWRWRVEQMPAIAAIHLSQDQRIGCVRGILSNVVARLRLGRDLESSAAPSHDAAAEGKLRHEQGYSALLLVQQYRILQSSIFETIQRNRSVLDFSLILSDLMLIADEINSELAQTVESFYATASLERKQDSTGELSSPEPGS